MEWMFLTIIVILIILMPFIYKKGSKDGLNNFFRSVVSNNHLDRLSHFKSQNEVVKKGGISFLGDSITEGYNVYEYFSDLLVYNRGISGDTTLGLLNRLDESVFKLNPSKVVVLIGTNDYQALNATNLDILERITLIVKTIKEKLPNTKIFIQSVYPVNNTLDKDMVGIRNNETIKLLNESLSKLDGITFINLYDKLIKDGNLNKEYTKEGLHINPKGYNLITKILTKHLK